MGSNMKKSVIAIVLAVGLCLPAAISQASNSHDRFGQMASLFARHRAVGHPLVQNLLPVRSTVVRPRIEGAQSAQQLQIANSTFSPATVALSSAQTAATADDTTSTSGIFRSFHVSTYTALGLIAGYLQLATWTPSGTTDQVIFGYQGGNFGSNAGATAAYQDALTKEAQAGDSATDCSSAAGTPCQIFNYTTTSGNAGVYTVAQLGRCVDEVAGAAPQATFTNQTTQIGNTLAAVVTAALTVAQSVCTSIPATPTATPTATLVPVTSSFNMLAARIEKTGAKFDWSLVNPPITQVALRGKVRLTMYWHVNSAPANVPFSSTFTVKHNGQTVATKTVQNKLNSAPNQTWASWVNYTVGSQAGNYRFAGTIAMGGHTGHVHMDFSVGSSGPAAPKSFSFRLVSLQILNSLKQKQATFRPGDTFLVKVTWKVQGLSKSEPVAIRIAFADPVTKRAEFVPTSATLPPLGNGTFPYKHSFLAPKHSVLIVVGLTIGRGTKRTSALLTVVP